MIKPERILIVGGNAAGPAAAAKAKRVNPNARVVLFEAGNFISTGTCEIPYVLSDEIKSYEDIILYSAGEFLNKKGVEVLVKHRIERIDRKNKLIIVYDITNAKEKEFSYDSLILTTGSLPRSVPGIPNGLNNVFYMKNVSDLIRLKEYLKSKTVRNAIIIGSGYIGIEVSEALRKNDINVTILEKEKSPLSNSEEEISSKVKKTLEENSVRFIGDFDNLEPLIKDEQIVSIRIDNEYLEVDLVILAVGIYPNSSLAQQAKLDIGTYGGIRVDKRLRTTDSNIFAAGDCIEYTNAVSRKHDYFPFATYAHNFGHIAGENAAGGNTNAEPIVKNISMKVYDKFFASVGLTSREANKYKFNFASVIAKIPNIVKVMPGSINVFGKLIFDLENKKILGATFYGGKEVSGYADLITSGIYTGQKIDYLNKTNYNYTPPLSPLINLLSVLGRKAIAKSGK